MSAVLYRHFSATGELLYVGCSLNLQARTCSHNYNSPWFKEIASIAVEHFEDIHQARLAEKIAIQTECPRENVRHKPDDLFRRPCKAPMTIGKHIQVDLLKKELGVSEMRLRRCIGRDSFNDISTTGRFFSRRDVLAMKKYLGITFKKMESIGISRNGGMHEN